MNNARLIIEQAKLYLSFQGIHKPFLLLAPFFKKHWKAHAGLLVLTFVEIVLMLTTAWFMGSITDVAIGQHYDKLVKLIPMLSFLRC
jgi:hypothetical protein